MTNLRIAQRYFVRAVEPGWLGRLLGRPLVYETIYSKYAIQAKQEDGAWKDVPIVFIDSNGHETSTRPPEKHFLPPNAALTGHGQET